jgi:uncharacterized protein YlxW (UPF0749 family)
MSQDDPTTKLPDESKYDKPGITAVLERINQLGEALQAQITDMRAEMREFRTETATTLRKIENRLSVLSDDMNRVRADLLDMESRILKLEEKAS